MHDEVHLASITAKDSPLTFADIQNAPLYRNLATPDLIEGDYATDFILSRLDTDEGTIQLSSLLHRQPIALIFGSYTCPPFRRQLDVLSRIYDEYCDRVTFLLIYIKEAHPEDGWVLIENRDEGIAIIDPTDAGEREAVAATCVLRTSVRIPVLVDPVDNSVARAYGAWPDRLYLIDKDGRIVFQSAEGPFGFLPDSLEVAIRKELGTPD